MMKPGLMSVFTCDHNVYLCRPTIFHIAHFPHVQITKRQSVILFDSKFSNILNKSEQILVTAKRWSFIIDSTH